MRRLTVEDERRYGIVPMGRPSNNVSTRLFTRMLAEGKEIEVDINTCLNAQKRQWTWKKYKLISVENNTCVLQEILYKELPQEKKEEFKRKIMNDEKINFEDYRNEEYLSDNIIRDYSTGELLYMHACYSAVIRISE